MRGNGHGLAVALCDRGALDGLAYWPDVEEAFLGGVGTTREAELMRYAAVIHLRTPSPAHYDHSNPVRVETAERAHQIDRKIEHAWRDHPRRFFVDSSEDFVDKTQRALAIIKAELPPCCAAHAAASS